MAEELLSEFMDRISEVAVIPSSGGVFEVSFGDELVFSKKALRRHADPGEVPALFRHRFGAA